MRSQPPHVLLRATVAIFVVAICCGSVSVASATPRTATPRPGDPLSRVTQAPGRATNPGTIAIPGSSGSSGAPWWMLAVVGLFGVAAGAGVCYTLTGRRSMQVAAQGVEQVGSVTPNLVAGPTTTDGDLGQLIESVIAARDLVDPSSVMARRLGAALACGGVTEVAPVGQPFDPSRHHAVKATATTDPASADLIAEVQRVGYCDAFHLIRPPEVVVFRLESFT